MKVLANREVCIGAGMCVMSAEAVFDQDDDALVVLLTEEIPEDEQKRVDDAVRLCPSGALRLQD
ncbi:ferredoxin [soil metagenome]